MLKNDYILINNKDVCIFTPFINIEYDLQKQFLNFIEGNTKEDEIYIPKYHAKKCNNELFEYYKNKTNKIWYQFTIDMIRCSFYINNRRVINSNIAKQKIMKKYNINVANKVALLCTQGALAFIIKQLQNSILFNNYFVSEHRNNKLKEMKIYVNLKKNNIIITKSLRIIKITNKGDDKTIITIYTIPTTITIYTINTS